MLRESKRGALLFPFLCIGLMFLGCGGNNKSTSPVSQHGPNSSDYTVYLSSVQDIEAGSNLKYYLLAYDPTNKTITDSFFIGYEADDIVASQDGSRLYFTRKGSGYLGSDPGIYAIDPLTGDTLAGYTGLGGSSITINAEEDYAFVGDDQVAIFSLPDLVPVYSEDKWIVNGGFLAGRNVAFYSTGHDFTFIDYTVSPVTLTQGALFGMAGESLWAMTLVPSISGDSLIILARDIDYNKYIMTVASDDMRIISQYSLSENILRLNGSILHPDGDKLLVRYYGQVISPPDHSFGMIYEVDTKTGAVSILYNGNNIAPRYWTYIKDISVSPNHSELLISGHHSFICLDLLTKESERLYNDIYFSGASVTAGTKLK